MDVNDRGALREEVGLDVVDRLAGQNLEQRHLVDLHADVLDFVRPVALAV